MPRQNDIIFDTSTGLESPFTPVNKGLFVKVASCAFLLSFKLHDMIYRDACMFINKEGSMFR